MCACILALLEHDGNSRQVVESLGHSGHKITLTETFTEAISLLQSRQKFDMVVSDVHLENGGNVFDFLRWVKTNPSVAGDTPFVLFSFRPSLMAKHLEDGVRTSARMLGAARYIAMDSFDSDEFRKQIDSLLPKVQKEIEVPSGIGG